MAPGEKVEKKDLVIIERIPVKSLVTNPANGAGTGRSSEVRGDAWSGDRTVAAADVSHDFGATWRPAQLDAPVDDGVGHSFRAGVELPGAGYHEGWARATVREGVMPPHANDRSPKGFLNNTMHRAAVRVS